MSEEVVGDPEGGSEEGGGSNEPNTETIESGEVGWRASLPDDLRESPALKNIKSVEDLAKEHVNVQKLIGVEKIERPKEDWSEDQWNQFYMKLGRPERPEDYDIGDLEIDESVPWDKDFESSMVELMHSTGMTSNQVKKLLGGYAEKIQAQYMEVTRQAEEARESAIQDLKNEWGKSFQTKVELAKRAIETVAGDKHQELAEIKLADGTMLGDNPLIVKVFSEVGAKMSEHGLVSGVPQRVSLSPEEALAEKNKLLSDENFLKAYMDENHLEHRHAVSRIAQLTDYELGES